MHYFYSTISITPLELIIWFWLAVIVSFAIGKLIQWTRETRPKMKAIYQRRMEEAVEREEYERAARLRDIIKQYN